jgi:hypothetical protein
MIKQNVKWYKKGKFYRDEIEFDTEPIFHIVRYRHNDSLSTNGYRYWIYTINNKAIFTMMYRTEYKMKRVTVPANDISREEFDAIKNNLIVLSDYSTTNGFYFMDFLKHYTEYDVTF